MIFLEHPQHGVHIAYTDQEVALCKQNGWSVRGETQVAEVEVADELNALRHEYERKFGKKPHHKKTVESLKRELA